MTRSILDQARALRDSAGVRLRDDLALVRVRGEDAHKWLNGQVTCDVREFPAGTGVYGLAVTVRGKIMADLWVVLTSHGAAPALRGGAASGNELGVLLPRSAQSTVLESFEHQIIMEDVELVPDGAVRVVSVQGPCAAAVVEAVKPGGDVDRQRCDELGCGGELLLVPAEHAERICAELVTAAEALGGGAVDDDGFELARLRAGRPRFERDFGIEQYPQEAGLEERAVSFNKGCYLGQEVICTLENRGRLTKRLARLRAEQGALSPGSELQDGEAHAVGKVTSTVFDPETRQLLALGYVRRTAAQPGAALQAQGARVELQDLV